MNCYKCGYPLPEGTNVCNYCGNVNGAPNQTQQQPNQAPPPPPPPQIQRPIAQGYIYETNPNNKFTKKCRYCKQLIDKKAVICPFCRQNQGESCSSVIAAVFIIFVFFCVIFNLFIKSSDEKVDNEISQIQTTTATTQERTSNPEAALDSAKKHLQLCYYSYTGLIKQLEIECGYNHEDSVYAADNCGADWNAEALRAAKTYIELASDRQQLIDILKLDEFTDEQIEYALTELGV